MLLETVRFEKRVVDSYLPLGEDKPKSEAWEFSLVVVEAGYKLELKSEDSASDPVDIGGSLGLLESFPKSASIELIDRSDKGRLIRSSIDFSLISSSSTRLSLSGISRFLVKSSRLVVSYSHSRSNSPA